ncbi:hypothetical protein QOL99_00315 [Deinococcus sp. MIMF12]|uniref:Uncharacterized protein n=1 Tax=Deinococcus rhizophilus TaxID=3049544 RepID=A0ABT7JC27_9DEIO|nr:hypothetical protein [Deinococcus rhizophilus]MDL2342592.1 hypothetical protein [Deinococcus rhizophilus]
MTTPVRTSPHAPLSIEPYPRPGNPDRYGLILPSGEIAGFGCTRFHACRWRDGWNARMNLQSQRSGPQEPEDGARHWHRGWERANAYERQREERERAREMVWEVA